MCHASVPVQGKPKPLYPELNPAHNTFKSWLTFPYLYTGTYAYTLLVVYILCIYAFFYKRDNFDQKRAKKSILDKKNYAIFFKTKNLVSMAKISKILWLDLEK